MPINNIKIRYTIAILWSLVLAIFGVFIYSNFVYRGMRLQNDIFPNFTAGSFNKFTTGLYLLVGSGFSADLFNLFSLQNLQTYGFFGILFGETLWPAILTWGSIGIIIGMFIKGIKYSVITALIFYSGICVIYFVIALLAGVNLAGGNFLATLGELLTGFIFIFLSSILAGFINGPH
ncbi:MAG: hypothetical protein K9W44_14610 [Candidatus Lokiarchaeota archaeon]|nr:hypothetical protein [Candidatus Harpocratesius repetitus]